MPVLPTGATVRALAEQHLPGLLAVQRACYGDGLLESSEAFAHRLTSPANCSLVLEVSGQVLAYLAAYHSLRGKVTPLHARFGPVAEPLTADTLYLHDLAVLPQRVGRGLAQALLQTLWAQATAQGLRYTALVSVQDSQAYWRRQGYAVSPLTEDAQRKRLAGYGAGAVYMEQRLNSAWPKNHCHSGHVSALSVMDR